MAGPETYADSSMESAISKILQTHSNPQKYKGD